MDIDTLPKALIAGVANYGAGQIAMRQKDRGIWTSTTWRQSYERVRRLALGLMELGGGGGERGRAPRATPPTNLACPSGPPAPRGGGGAGCPKSFGGSLRPMMQA